jgi:hypothetical protein
MPGLSNCFTEMRSRIGLRCTPKPAFVQRKVDASKILSDRYFSRIRTLPEASLIESANDGALRLDGRLTWWGFAGRQKQRRAWFAERAGSKLGRAAQ